MNRSERNFQGKSLVVYRMNLHRGLLVLFLCAVMLAFICSLALLAHGQQTGNTHYAAQFPGSTVAARVTSAQNDCTPNIPCLIVIDATLATATEGTLPAPCSQCLWQDFRSPGSVRIASSTAPTLTAIAGTKPLTVGPPQDMNVLRVIGTYSNTFNNAPVYVNTITTGTPVTITTTGAAVGTVGDTICVQHVDPAPSTNDGCFPTLSVTNSPCCSYTYTNAGAASYKNDQTLASTGSLLPAGLVTDEFGMVHLLYGDSCNSAYKVGSTVCSSYTGGAVLKERTSITNGQSWNTPVTVFQDTGGTGCGASAPCAINPAGAGKQLNGKVVAEFAKYDPINATWKGLYFTTNAGNGTAWSTPVQLANPSPGGHNWAIGFGYMKPCGQSAAQVALNATIVTDISGFNYFYSWAYDNFNGSAFKRITNSTLVGGNLPGNENDFACSADGTTIIVVSRNDNGLGTCLSPCGDLLLTYSTDSGTTWTTKHAALQPSLLGVQTYSSVTFVAPMVVPLNSQEDVTTWQPGTWGNFALVYGERYGGATCTAQQSARRHYNYCSADQFLVFNIYDVISNGYQLPSMSQTVYTGGLSSGSDTTYPQVTVLPNSNFFFSTWSTFPFSGTQLTSMQTFSAKY